MLKQFSAWDAGILLIGSIFPLDCVVISMDLLLDCTLFWDASTKPFTSSSFTESQDYNGVLVFFLVL